VKKSNVEVERAASYIRLKTVTKSQKSDKDSGRERYSGRQSVCMCLCECVGVCWCVCVCG